MSDVEFVLRIAEVKDETPDIRRFELVMADSGTLPVFDAGAHLDIEAAAGLVRQYSLCNGPDQTDRFVIAVKKEMQSRGGSAAMHALVAGGTLRARGPRNHFAVNRAEGHILLLAGGIGVTPLLSMARHLEAEDHPFTLHYFARSEADLAFAGEMRAMAERGRAVFHTGLSPDDTADVLRSLTGACAVDAGIYICGPRPFMDCAEALARAAVGTERVHLEHFSGDPEALSRPQESFTVCVASSGLEITVEPGKSILDALSERGIYVDMLCQEGVCGTCVTGVLEGIPDHRDAYLSDAERAANNVLTICCSRSRTPRLVLDL